jgi:hypothetical protein
MRTAAGQQRQGWRERAFYPPKKPVIGNGGLARRHFYVQFDYDK